MSAVPSLERSRWPAAMLLSTAAEYLDCKTVKQVEQLIKDGEIGAIQFNERGDRRVLKEEIDAYLYRVRQQKVSA